MKVTPRSRRAVRLQNIIFVGLFLVIIGLLAWLSTRYNYQADWTAGGRNTLSPASIALLDQLGEPVTINAFASENTLLRKRISELVARYQRYKPDITLSYVNPELEPQRVRELGITMDGELLLEYQGRQEQIREINEAGLTNALQRMARGGERRLLFLQGHGERDPHGEASFDLAGWTRQLETKGIKVEGFNLASQARIPADATALVIASPRTALLPGEVQLIRDYLDQGGNLLWLVDPGDLAGMEGIAGQLGIVPQPGIIIDPNVSQVGMMLFGTDDPRVTLVASYGDQAIVSGFEYNTLFPIARGIELKQSGWDGQEILKSLSNTWAETGKTQGKIAFDEGSDINGPLAVGIALSRARVLPDTSSDEQGNEPSDSGVEKESVTQQRVVVIGDGDFLSNGFLGLGGNLQLGMNVINWLGQDDSLIAIPTRTTTDSSLALNDTEIAVIGFGFLIFVPLVLLGSGLFIWLRRRKR